MKVKVKGLVFVGFAAMIFAANAMAVDNTVTSKDYVDTKFQTKANIQTSFTDQNKTSETLYPSMGAVTSALAETGATVQNGTLSVTQAGSTVGTFTANQATNSTVTIDLTGADGTTITLDTANNQFKANTTGGVAENGTNLVTGGQVYDAIAASEEATTYTADSTTISLDTNNQFSANTTGGVAENGTNLVTGGQVYDAIADQATTDANTYQTLSTEASIGGTNGAWTPVDATVSSSGTSVPTTAAVYNAIQSATGGNSIPTMDTSICNASHPCVLTNDTSTGNLVWERIAQVGD